MNSVKSTHMLRHEIFNACGTKCQLDKACKHKNRNKQRTEKINKESSSEHVSLSPSLSSGSTAGTINNNNKDDEHLNTTTRCNHLKGDGRRKKANMTCMKLDTDDILRISLDTPISKKRKPPNEEYSCEEKPKNDNCTHALANESSERTNGSVCSSIGGDGGDDVPSETKFVNDTTNSNNECSSRDVTGERDRNTNSSTITEHSLRARRMSCANSLSISNSTLTNVNILNCFPFVIQ